ncbi:MAG TPA: maleylacetoacetate isomerase [Sphingobium sp.]|nr:maleylacetoacetate isomerase [Sphingobium sp.]
MIAPPLILHGYWRSGTSYRTRIALNAKGLDYTQKTYDLRAGAHRSDAFRALNPQGLVPALEAGSMVLTQSTAILEWLEERWPTPALLPADPDERAIVRAMTLLVACDIHPLNNLRVLNHLRSDFGADGNAVRRWIGHWVAEGFTPLETMIARHGGRYSFGDSLSMADCHLVPQVYSAERFGVDLAPYPAILAVAARLRDHPAVAAAHPDRQPDSDAS